MPVKDRELRWTNLLQHFQEVSRLALAGGYEKLADYVAEAVNDLTGASVALWMMDEKENVLRIQAGKGLRKKHIEDAITPVEPGSSITSIALRDRRPVFRKDILDETEEPSFYNMEEAKKRGWRSFLSVPLLGQAGQPLGALSIYYTEQRDSPEPDQALLSTFANQIAIAFENVRTREHSRQQSDALRKIVGAIGAEADPLPLILEEAVKLFGVEYGSFSLMDPEAGQLTYQAMWEKGKMIVGEQIPKDKRVRDWKKGVTGHVARMGRAYRIGNVRKDPYYEEWYGATVSEVAVPLKDADGKTIGVLNLESPVQDAFSQTDEDLCQDLASVAATAIEKARLFETLQRLNARLESLHQVVQKEKLEDVLPLIVDSLSHIFFQAPCTIRLYDAEKDEFGHRVATGGLTDQLVYPPRPNGASRHVLETKAPLYVENTSVTLPNKQPAIRRELVKEGVRAIAFLPLLSKIEGDVMGILYVDLPTPHRFSEDDKRILRIFADQAAIAIENVRLYEQRIEDIAALQEINDAITAKERIEVAELITEKAAKLAQADNSSLWIVDEQRNRLVLAAIHGQKAKVDELPIDEHSINGWVAMTGKPYICRDACKDGHYLPWYEGVKSSITVPLIFRERIIGTIDAESNELDAFSDYQLGMLWSFADAAASAIENARLYERLDRKIDSLEAVNSVGQQLTSGIRLSEQEILKLIYKQATELMDTDNMYIALYDEATDTVRFGLMYVDGKPEHVESRTGGKGRTERIIRDQQPILITTRAKSEAWYDKPDRREYIGEPFSSWVGVPMMVGDKVMGVIATYHKTREYVYDKDHLEALHLMANQAAIALQNARLFHQLGQRVQELDALRALAEELSAGALPDAI